MKYYIYYYIEVKLSDESLTSYSKTKVFFFRELFYRKKKGKKKIVSERKKRGRGKVEID